MLEQCADSYMSLSSGTQLTGGLGLYSMHQSSHLQEHRCRENYSEKSLPDFALPLSIGRALTLTSTNRGPSKTTVTLHYVGGREKAEVYTCHD